MGIKNPLDRHFKPPYVLSVTQHNAMFISGKDSDRIRCSLWAVCHPGKALQKHYGEPNSTLNIMLNRFPDLDKLEDIFDMLRSSYEDQLLAIKWVEAGYLNH